MHDLPDRQPHHREVENTVVCLHDREQRGELDASFGFLDLPGPLDWQAPEQIEREGYRQPETHRQEDDHAVAAEGRGDEDAAVEADEREFGCCERDGEEGSGCIVRLLIKLIFSNFPLPIFFVLSHLC